MTIWDVTVNGVNLFTKATHVDELPGFGGMPARVDGSVAVSGSDGLSSQIGLFNPGEYVISVLVEGYDRTTGTVTTNREQHVWDNIAWVQRQFASDALLDVGVVVPDGSTRTSKSDLTQPVPPVWLNRYTCRMKFGMRIPSVYWSGAEFNTVAVGPRTFTLDAGNSNAFMNDISFFITAGLGKTLTNPKLVANNLGGVKPYITIPSLSGTTGTGFWDVDCAAGTSTESQRVTHGGTALSSAKTPLGAIDYGGSHGLLFRVGPPYSITFTATGTAAATSTVSISGTEKYF